MVATEGRDGAPRRLKRWPSARTAGKASASSARDPFALRKEHRSAMSLPIGYWPRPKTQDSRLKTQDFRLWINNGVDPGGVI